MVKVKICGITNEKDALDAVSLGADALGFIFYNKSPRSISPTKARKIIEKLPAFVTPVGVFVNEKETVVGRTAQFCGLHVLQFHGDESPSYCCRFKRYKVIKAFRVGKDFDFGDLKRYEVSGFLFDTYQKDSYGGTGKTFRWSIFKRKRINGPLILSGGLNPKNIKKAVKEVKPYGVDISSGVEKAPGRKDIKKLKALFNQLKTVK